MTRYALKNPDIARRIAELHDKDGVTLRGLAERFGISLGTVHRKIIEGRKEIEGQETRIEKPKKRGNPQGNRKVTDAQIEKMIELYQSGERIEDIGKALEISHHTVRNNLKKRGVFVAHSSRRRGQAKEVEGAGVEETQRDPNDTWKTHPNSCQALVDGAAKAGAPPEVMKYFTGG